MAGMKEALLEQRMQLVAHEIQQKPQQFMQDGHHLQQRFIKVLPSRLQLLKTQQ
jgi:hypothetical protein